MIIELWKKTELTRGSRWDVEAKFLLRKVPEIGTTVQVRTTFTTSGGSRGAPAVKVSTDTDGKVIYHDSDSYFGAIVEFAGRTTGVDHEQWVSVDQMVNLEW